MFWGPVRDASCRVETGKALVEAGLHPATGGNGMAACSGDLLLEALVACAGVTLTLLRLTERYCVVYQSLRQPAEITVSL